MSSAKPTEEQAPVVTSEPPISETANNLSPPRTSTKRGTKERREPSVTPRKFTRFFAPKIYGSLPRSKARQALNDITTPALNRITQSSPIRPFRDTDGPGSSPLGLLTRESKRRKFYHALETSNKEHGFVGSHHDGVMSSPCERAMHAFGDGDSESEEEIEEPVRPQPLKRIRRMEDRGLGGQLFSRSIGTSTRQRCVYPVNDWRDHTAGFYSRPHDIHVSMSLLPDNQQSRTIPFCAQGLNREGSTLVALGDEEGHVRLLDTAQGGEPPFTKDCYNVRIHSNAIIDMVFTEDDNRIATASGDQTARVYDMQGHATIAILGSHVASLKQVRWQPGSSNVLATSSRDGSLQLWDLRCNTKEGPMFQIFCPLSSDPASRYEDGAIMYNRPTVTIFDAHKTQAARLPSVSGYDQLVRPGEQMPRTGDVSVTAIQFLPVGREHLILSGSEVDASVKLWDIRHSNYKLRPQGALASTAQPLSHSKFRHFGINSITMNTDGSRFYTLCKDNTVYAYSTEHLMLGHAPELSIAARTRPPAQNTNRNGLGPLYGFRHPKLHATTFYVKSAIRKARNGKCEMLAVGSSDGYPILFPTDERYLPSQTQLLSPSTTPEMSPALLESRPTLPQASNPRFDNQLLVSTNGTALQRGHDREIGSLTWSSSGDLVTVGDDYLVRLWREDRNVAKDLRTGGETGGRRWGCGWADVEADYDLDDNMEL
ncbi:hypothetical protein PZA11_006087 [Diplocarpon coronariae]|nr:hypothetical protein JHW43_008614 [Diplocarpon mali]